MLPFKIRPAIFWDMDQNSLNEQAHMQYIIRQVLQYGTLEEFMAVEQYYGHETMIRQVKNIGYLDPKSKAFVISYYHINPEEMLCCIQRQSHPKYWD
ncbi:MAG TPA: hypothetical protein P5228_01120 [Bacteroidales bacterium]|nr:hypothetical protein [Bacteroidales bacterium]HRZ49170.1 hypothetical protein [Bacteroidales bacterium]